jgi:hypothetical protein
VPSTTALTLRMLGFQVLLVLRLEWETLCPKTTPLPQMLHLAILTPPEYLTFRRTSISKLFFNHKLTNDIISQKILKCNSFFKKNIFLAIFIKARVI